MGSPISWVAHYAKTLHRVVCRKKAMIEGTPKHNRTTPCTTLRKSLNSLRQQAWFVLFILGAGASFALIETHRQLVNNNILVGSPEALFFGHLTPALFLLGRIWWMRRRGHTDYRFFLKRPLLCSVPVAAFSVGVLIVALIPLSSESASHALLALSAYLLGFAVTALLFAWAELAATLFREQALFAVALALMCGAFFHLLIVALCYASTTQIVLAIMSLSIIFIYKEACLQKGTSDQKVYGKQNNQQKQDSLEKGSREGPSAKIDLALPFLVFVYFLAFSCLFSDGAASIHSYSYAFMQLFTSLGILLCGITVCLIIERTPSRHQSNQTLHMLIFLIMIVCFLCAYLLGEHVLATLPLYLARELIIMLIFWGAFIYDGFNTRIRCFSLSMTLWVTAWFTYRILRWILDTLSLPTLELLEVFSLVVLMIAAAFIFVELVQRMRRNDRNRVGESVGAEEGPEKRTTVLENISEEFNLTDREKELLPYLASGFGAEYIAEEFTISPATVRTHAHNIYAKTNVASQRKLIELIDVFVRNSVTP
jgi:DNA-binding CsgD family transcriptional regulator